MTSAHPAPGTGELHTWWLSVPPPGATPRPGLHPSDEDGNGDGDGQRQWQRATRPGRSLHRHRRAFAHAGLRLLLAGYLPASRGEPTPARAACPVCAGPHGRPYVSNDQGLEFSMSHSGDGVLYAFTTGGAVGVDVESGPVLDRTRHTVSRWLAPHELRAIEAAPEGERPAAFLRTWVRREAWLKAAGTGLAHGMGPAPVQVPGGPQIIDLEVPDGYTASAAAPAGTRHIRHRRIPPGRILDTAV
ncbi:4'-phosphopantetheinyl transferase superfamily protein [Streptomyces sp. R33]|uniref:4'-phosphopantetheinyl transferase superfamily protein n=1 Tax=Streptomyces sp. R33 TaxID=3238629 RepID=A0AB39YJM5_9ACTN